MKIFCFLGLAVLAACTPGTPAVPTKTGAIQLTLPTMNDEWITYQPVAPLVLETYDIEFPYAEEAVIALLQDCGKSIDTKHISDVAKAFSKTNGIAYVFTPEHPADGTSGYVVTAYPNDAKYTTFEEFERDFELCFAGGNFYPMASSEDYILFHNSCDTDAAGVTDCDTAKEALNGSVRPVTR